MSDLHLVSTLSNCAFSSSGISMDDSSILRLSEKLRSINLLSLQQLQDRVSSVLLVSVFC